jgi:glycolate oxidase
MPDCTGKPVVVPLLSPEASAELSSILGPDGLLLDEAALTVYSRDASHMTLGRPCAVALPRDALALQRAVAVCARRGIPVVCRGTGTGLSGGAVPHEGDLVLSTARLNRLDNLDPGTLTVHAEAGVLNDQVTRFASPASLHFAPDPSSQAAASIGGNIAENAGGPHCLRLGVTRRHLRRLDWVDASGRAWTTGRGQSVERGLDLVSLLCGSEGTLGLVTGADLSLVPDPPAVVTLLAFFPELDRATSAVVGLLGQGMLPVAVEMVDQAMLVAVEEAFGFGFSTDVAAAMIVEFAGLTEEVGEDAAAASAFLAEAGASEVRTAADEAERLELWKCRKKAFGAVGRLAPSYVTMDVVVPLGSLPALVSEIQVIKARHGVEVATAFHAGDGNLHPGVHYDDRDPGQTAVAHAAADEIIRAALARGGSATGEHGVGIEKLHVLPWQLDAGTAELLPLIKNLLDPDGLLNPGKALPDPSSDFAPAPAIPPKVDYRWQDLTVTAQADVPLARLQSEALGRGLMIPVGYGLDSGSRSATVADLVNHLVTGPAVAASGHARDALLEIWAETGDGRSFHAGAPVFKNVAGYDLVGLIAGASGTLARVDAATFQLRPAPRDLGVGHLQPREGCPLSVLEDLVTVLAERDASLGGPAMAYETDGRILTGMVHLWIPGRNRPWDLQDWDRRIREYPDLVCAGFDIRGWSEDLIDLERDPVPAWLETGEWSILGSLPGQFPGPLPRSAGRFVWQSAPRVVWAAGPTEQAAGWHHDVFRQDGIINPPPAAPAGVPTDLLTSLQSLFDPEGRLSATSGEESR